MKLPELLCFFICPRATDAMMEADLVKRSKLVRWNIVQSFALVVSSLSVSLVTSYALRALGWNISPALVVLSAALAMWALFSYLGWEIQSWKGVTLPERANRAFFRFINWIALTCALTAAFQSTFVC